MTREILIGPELGKGGFASVHWAVTPGDGRSHAWKQVRRTFTEEGDVAARIRVAFPAEAWIVSAVDHPGVPKVTAYWPERRAFLMDRVDGLPLDRLSEVEWTAVPLPIRLRLALDVLETVHAVHESGHLHLDLKFSNLMLDGTGRIHLIDFGVAALYWVRTALGGEWPLPVSADYAPPELLANEFQALDPRSDLYSVGVLLYRLLTGRQPYRLQPGSGDELAAQVERVVVRPLATLDPSIPSSVDPVLEIARASDAAARPATALALARDLAAAFEPVEPASREETSGWATEVLAAHEVPPVWDGQDAEDRVPPFDPVSTPSPPTLPRMVTAVSVEAEPAGESSDVAVSWSPQAGVEGYRLRVWRDGDLRPRVIETTEPTAVVTLDQAGSYGFRVAGVLDGLVGPWSDKETLQREGRGASMQRLALVVGATASILVLAVVGVLLVRGLGDRGALVVAVESESGGTLTAEQDGEERARQVVPPGREEVEFGELDRGAVVLRFESGNAAPVVRSVDYRSAGQRVVLDAIPRTASSSAAPDAAGSVTGEGGVPDTGRLTVRVTGGNELELRAADGGPLERRTISGSSNEVTFDELPHGRYACVLRGQGGVEDRRWVELSTADPAPVLQLSVVEAGDLTVRTQGGLRLVLDTGAGAPVERPVNHGSDEIVFSGLTLGQQYGLRLIGHGGKSTGSVVAMSATQQTVSLQLVDSGTLKASVAGGDRLSISGPSGFNDVRAVDPDGDEARFDDLPFGEYRLRLARGSLFDQVSTTVAGSSQQVELTLPMPGAGVPSAATDEPAPTAAMDWTTSSSQSACPGEEIRMIATGRYTVLAVNGSTSASGGGGLGSSAVRIEGDALTRGDNALRLRSPDGVDGSFDLRLDDAAMAGLRKGSMVSIDVAGAAPVKLKCME
jgi:serine/threonine protein kinase